jgi:hypothetical protein
MASAVRRRALKPPIRSTRNKPVISYAESSDSSLDPTDEESESEDEDRRPPPRTRTRAVVEQTSQTMQTPRKHPRAAPHHTYDSDDSDHHHPKRTKRPKPNTPKSSAFKPSAEVQTSGLVPEWHTLPYHVLVGIFEYATYPLYDDHTFQPLPSGRWLLDVAYLCRAFAEPALTVLYKSPPLVPMVQAHRLVDLLEEDPKSLAYGYRQKVKSLRIDVGQVAAYSLPGRGHLDLYGLIKDLPQLDDLEFYHQKDMSPYRNLDDTIKWTYPETLFEALEYVDPQADGNRGDKTRVRTLQSWRWSSRLAGKKWPVEKIPEMHAKPFFASLKKVAFVNYQITVPKGNEDDPKHEQILATALLALPHLKHLTFESSTLMNSELLPLLPKSLRNLELINCWEVIADDFAAFLLTHGHHLRVLTLNHNQSLSLGFLPILGLACPELQVFRMNLTYYNLHATYRDSEPQYKQLLTADQTPVWPQKLQTIELIQLRKWETDAAEVFFQSLLDSAGVFIDLRRLTVQAILNIGWRDRASFRDKWVGSLGRVFKRVNTAPKPLICLPKLPPTSAEDSTLPRCKHEDGAATRPAAMLVIRSSLRPSNTTEQTIISSEPAMSLGNKGPSPPRRSNRVSGRKLPAGGYAESPDNSEGEDMNYVGINHEEAVQIVRRPNRLVGLQRELSILKDTAGIDSPNHPSSPKSLAADASSDEQPLTSKFASNIKRKEVIQGMCEVVEIRIDNLRPMENQFTADDFLGPPESDDEEWNGDNDGETSYAW